MRRQGSLFEIDQEPLFEPLALETEAGGEPDWGDALDQSPALEPSGDHEADEPERRRPVPGSRLLVAVAAIGAVGFMGSRLTQAGEPPSAPSSTAPQSPTILAAAQPSPAPQPGPTTRPHGARLHRAPRRERTPRALHGSRSAPKVRQRRPTTSTPLSAVPARALAPVTQAPPAQAPAPEPQGFTGEFF